MEGGCSKHTPCKSSRAVARSSVELGRRKNKDDGCDGVGVAGCGGVNFVVEAWKLTVLKSALSVVPPPDTTTVLAVLVAVELLNGFVPVSDKFQK